MDIDVKKREISHEDLVRIKALYDANLAYVDSEVGRLVEGLKRLGLYDDTLLVVLSDHGEAFGEHGRFLHNTTVYDEMIRVPLIMKLPRGFDLKAKEVKGLVELVDVMPTIAEIFGFEVPGTVHGESLYDVLDGGVSNKKYVYSRTVGEKPVYGLRSAGYKYILNSESSKEEFYDIRTDRGERRNIIGGSEDLAAPFRARLAERLDSSSAGASDQMRSDDKMVEERLRALGYID